MRRYLIVLGAEPPMECSLTTNRSSPTVPILAMLFCLSVTLSSVSRRRRSPRLFPVRACRTPGAPWRP